MKPGTIVLAAWSEEGNIPEFANECARYLESRGRRNVVAAAWHGEPSPFETMRMVYERDGIDTFCILPLCICEGNLTVWKLPASLNLPDNSGSWTMIGQHDVAVRFSTAMGKSERMADAVVRRLGAPEGGTGVILLFHGSALSMAGRTAAYYREKVTGAGWICREAFSRGKGKTMEDAVTELRLVGCGMVVLVPFLISMDGRSYREAVRVLDAMGMPFEGSPPVSDYPEFMEILDSKVPEGW